MGKKRKAVKTRPLTLPQVKSAPPPEEVRDSLADIVIPVYGAVDKLDLCLRALTEQGLHRRANIFCIDDAGPEDPLPVIRKYPGVRFRRHPQNAGFAATCNTGASLSKSPFLIFLNSDVVMLPGWYEALISEFSNPKVGIVGGKLLFPPDHPIEAARNTVQHAGMVFDFAKEVYHRFIGWSAQNPRTNLKGRVQAVTGALLAVRRELFVGVGGFDPQYGRGTWEDIHLCADADKHGYIIMYTPYAVGYHYTGASATASGEGFPLRRNRVLFLDQFADRVIWDEWRAL